MQGGLGFGVTSAGNGGREESLADGNGEAGGGAGDGEDGGCVEGGPGPDLADVPPEVLGVRVPKGEGDGADE